MLIDSALHDRQVLIDGVPEGVEVVAFGGDREGLADLAAWAVTAEGYDAIHLLCHGAPGRLTLGTQIIDCDTLSDPQVQDALTDIGLSLREGGSVQLYSCELAQGQAGKTFITAMALAMGVPVAASATLVGAAALGGSWTLEHTSGIAAGLALQWPAYDHVLGTIAQNVTTFDSVSSTAYVTTGTNGYAPGTVLNASNLANTGWDVEAQSSSAGITFRIQGSTTDGSTIDSSTRGAIRVQADDVDYVIFKSNVNGFYFDLTSFDIRNPRDSNFTIQAIDASGALIGTAVPRSMTGITSTPASAFQRIDMSGNADFLRIYGFKLSFPTPYDNASTPNTGEAPFFDNIIVANIGVPVFPTTKVLTATLSDDSNIATDDITNVTAQTINGTLDGPLLSGESVQVSFNGGVSWTTASNAVVGSSTWSATGNLLSGNNALMARVFTADGSTAAVSRNYTLDTAVSAPPTPVLLNADNSGSTSDNITKIDTPTITGTAEVGSTVTLYDTDGSTILGTDVAANGTWSIRSNTLTQPTHTLTVKAVDVAGNVSTVSSPLVLVIDGTVPTAVALSSTSATTAAAGANAAVATLSATDATAVTYALATGSAGNDSGNGSFAISGTTLSVGNTPLSAGTYNLYLSATDAAGNVSYLAQTFTVNTVPTVSSIVRAGGAGTTAANNATSVAFTVTFSESVTGVDVSDFALATSSSASGVISNVTGSGSTYTVTVNNLAGDGSLGLNLNPSGTGIQNFSNVAIAGGFTGINNYVLDHTAPAAPSAPDLRALDDTGGFNNDNVTSVTTPVFTGTAEAGSMVRLYDTDGTELGSAPANSGNWSITSNALTSGSHTLTVKATDAAGNVSAASSALVVIVDAAAPTALALSGNTIATVNANGGAAVATLSATDDSAITYALAVGNGTNNAHNASFAVSGNTLSVGGSPLSAGTYQVYLSATDAAGNVSFLAQTINVVQAPSVSSIVRAGGAAAGVATSATSASYTVTFSESVSGVDVSDFALFTNNAASGVVSNVVGSGTTYTVTVNNLAGDGSLRLDLNPSGTGIQNGSNIAIAGGYSSGASYVLDHTAPVAPSRPDLRTLDDSGSSQSDNITSETTQVFTGTAESGTTVRLYVTDGTMAGTFLLGSVTTSSGNWAIPVSTLSEGTHTLIARSTDAAGNVSTDSLPLTVTIDTTVPTALALSSNNIATAHASAGATVATLSATDSSAITYALAVGNGTNNASNGNFSVSGNTLSVGSAQLLPGAYQIYLSATDVAGNVSYLAQTINVVNAPVVTSIVRAGGAGTTVASSATLVDFTVTFSESVTGVDVTDFMLSSTNFASGVISNVAGSGTTYTVSVNNLAGDGQLRLDLNPSGTNIQNSGNIAVAGGYVSGASYVLDHTPPLAPSSATMSALTDTGVSQTDRITNNSAPTFTGTAEANATVRLYDTDGTTVLDTVTANGLGAWEMNNVALTEGSHTLTVRQTDAAGNGSPASSAITVVLDTSAATPATPSLAVASDSGTAGDRVTNVSTPTITGTAEAFAAVTLYATDGVTVLETTTADINGNWTMVTPQLSDGTHTLTARQTDRAGNVSGASLGLVLQIDTQPPVAPSAPVLTLASDSGTPGDNITTVTQPVLTGTALPNAAVRLYDTNGITVVGTAVADGSGNWSITNATLTLGTHTLTARQLDVAGNLSSAGLSLTLTIEAPPAPPSVTLPPTTVDGVPVSQQPVFLPGGGTGTQTVIGIITNDRAESAGNAGVADIPLANNGGNTLLLAQLAPGYGLTASGGTSQPVSTTNLQLTQAILAATPGHASNDKNHLTGEGVKFLNQLTAGVPLLVNSITPVSTSNAPTGPLTLTGTSNANQHTALVIDTSGLAPGSNLVLNSVDFAAIIGAATVTGNTNRQILTGDVASQGFTVTDGNSSAIFSGGGNDRVTINSTPTVSTQSLTTQTASTATPLATSQAVSTNIVHGGQGSDTVAFSGTSTDYNVSLHRGYAIVSSKAQPGQQSVVINAEDLSFANTTLKIENDASLTSLAGLYQNVLGRQADHLGIEFWADAHAGGVSYGEIALRIIASVEAQGRQAVVFNGNSAHDVELLYLTIFGRSSDAVGLNFWTNAMAQGMSFTQVASHFIEAPEMDIHKIGAQNWDFQLS
ncbi:Ig-like domain-containing protein [Pigmentiphaga aceris]|uniref:Ig-like domain-containing protein n=1 Tax=Pigmentiphaga aceris TaxID=1940612 RepID=UPI00165204F9|nr:Ig-like domain-containing protein [Pigmentiphaga aceris]